MLSRFGKPSFVPFDIGHGFPVLRVEHGNHFAQDAVMYGVAHAQPVRDTVANLDFIN